MPNQKIPVELTPKEIELIIGAIAHFVPADRSTETALTLIYLTLKEKLDDFVNGQK